MTSPYTLAIVGGRNFSDWADFQAILGEYTKKHGMPARVVSGGAVGVDHMAARWAMSRPEGVMFREFKPDWTKNGRAAGILRNTDIVAAADRVLALRNPSSKCTHDSIRKAKEMDKHLTVVYVPRSVSTLDSLDYSGGVMQRDSEEQVASRTWEDMLRIWKQEEEQETKDVIESLRHEVYTLSKQNAELQLQLTSRKSSQSS